MNNKSIHIDTSIIVPAYNEAALIADTLDQLAIYSAQHKAELGVTEIVVVAAGQDETAEISRGFSKRFDAIQVLQPAGHAGKGRDVRLGFKAARGDIALFMDADVATPLHHIAHMVALLKNGQNDVVIGVRQLSRIHKSLFRTLFSLASNWITRVLLFPKIKDTQCGFKGFTRPASRQLFASLQRRGWGFDIEVLQLAKEQKLRVHQLTINDWHETRNEDLRGDNLLAAGSRTFGELLAVRLAAWGRSLELHWRWWLALAMGSSAGLALYIGMQQSVWFDEAYSIMISQRPVAELLALTAVDTHPPLYYLLLKAWATLFSWHELALRSLSVIFLGAAVGVLGLLVKKLFSVRAMLWVLPFVTLAPFALRYGFEVRMYALAALIALTATLFLVYAVEAEGKKARLYWAAYAVLVALGMYTLYYTAFIWIAHLLWLTFVVRVKGKPLTKQPWTLAYLGAVALFLPWLPSLVSQLTHSALAPITEPVMVPQLTTILSFSIFYMPQWQLDPWTTLLLLLLTVGTTATLVSAFRTASSLQKRNTKLLVWYVLIPVLLMMLVSLPPLRPLFVERYIAPFILVGYALFGISCYLYMAQKKRKKWPVALLAMAMIVSLVGGVFCLREAGNYNYQRLSRPMAKPVMQSVAECGRNNQLLIADDPLLYYELSYYNKNHCHLVYHSEWEVSNRGGFAPIYQRSERVDRYQNYSTTHIAHVFSGKDPRVVLPAKYRLTNVQTFGDYHVRSYVLTNAE